MSSVCYFHEICFLSLSHFLGSLSSASSRDTYLEMIQIMIKKKNIEHLKFNLLVKQIQG